jgi:hypothetical protein
VNQPPLRLGRLGYGGNRLHPPGTQHGVINVCSLHGLYDAVGINNQGAASATWPSANRAIFVPFELDAPAVAKVIAWVVGTTPSGNVDAGIYDLLGNRLVSGGGAAIGSGSAPQVLDITDTALAPGVYMLGLAMDSTGGSTVRWPNITAQWSEVVGVRQMDSAYPLPSTATFAVPTGAYIPHLSVGFRSVL